MVKNTKGGNKAKKHARKSGFTESSATVKTRLATHEDELYACCSKLLGNGMCLVTCIDGKERICIIRNKFRGRGKRGNVITRGTWCLVGRRDFEKPKEDKLEKTDLLEVYNELEKKNIIQKETSLKNKWTLFTSLNSVINETQDDDDVVNFYRNVDLPSDAEDDDTNDTTTTDEDDTNDITTTNTTTTDTDTNTTTTDTTNTTHYLGKTINIDDI